MEELKTETASLAAELRDTTRQKAAELKEDTANIAARLKDSVHHTAAVSGEEAASWESESETEGQSLDHRQLRPGLSEQIQLLTQRTQTLVESRRKLYSRMSFYRRSLLKGNPTASSKKFAEALKELRAMAEKGHDPQ